MFEASCVLSDVNVQQECWHDTNRQVITSPVTNDAPSDRIFTAVEQSYVDHSRRISFENPRLA